MKNNILETVASVNFVSQTGLVRKNNEDSLLVMQEDGVFAVMDGMGGASAGEVASSMVADCIQKGFVGHSLILREKENIFFSKPYIK